MSEQTAQSQSLIKTLRALLTPHKVLSDPGDCWPYGYDNSRLHCCPDVVVMAESHADVETTVRLCNEFKIPLVARGRGTGTPGGAVPIHKGVVLSLEKMDKIINFDPRNRVITVEAGVLNSEVQKAARTSGLFWPPDPSSFEACSIGGNLGYNAAGPHAVKYGTTRENTLGLTAVTGGGETIRAGVYTTKGVGGYDFTRLLIGSEGTLAIVTQATLKLTPLPTTKRTVRIIYRSLAAAADAIINIMAQPNTPCVLEFLDDQCLQLIKQHTAMELPEHSSALLLLELDNPPEALTAAIQAVRHAATNDDMLDFRIAETEKQISQLWQARKVLSPLLRTLASKKINEDIVVPVAAMHHFITATQALAQQYQILIVNFGHAGNGNLHVNILFDGNDEKQSQRAQECLHEIFNLVITCKGTISGEHGIGIVKREFLKREIDPTTLRLMQQVKKIFDPNGILNPGKIFIETE